AVAGARIASARAAMGQVVQYLDAFEDDVVGANAFDVDHEADAARVMFVLGRPEALRFGYAVVVVHLLTSCCHVRGGRSCRDAAMRSRCHCRKARGRSSWPKSWNARYGSTGLPSSRSAPLRRESGWSR